MRIENKAPCQSKDCEAFREKGLFCFSMSLLRYDTGRHEIRCVYFEMT